jgi:hypothetical protein
MSDADACIALRLQLAEEDGIIHTAIKKLAEEREDYLSDRAFRLLSAVAAGSAVRPLDPALSAVFTRERALGHLPLTEAFRELGLVEPGLVELSQAAEAITDWKAEKRALTRQLGWLAGARARSGDRLMRSDLIASLILQYLTAVARSDHDVLTKPFLGNRRTWMDTGLPGPARSRASN